MRTGALLSLLAFTAFIAADARDSQVMAPAPAPQRKGNVLTFILSADNVTTTAGGFKLGGVAKNVPYTAGPRVRFLPTASFANSTVGSPLVSADGAWLDKPQAVLYGQAPGGNLSALGPVTLTNIAYSKPRTLTFTTDAASPDVTQAEEGPVSAAAKDSEQGTGPKLLTNAPADQTWTGVTLVIQSSTTALKKPATDKFFGWGWGWGRPWGWGGYGGYGGWGHRWGGWGWGK